MTKKRKKFILLFIVIAIIGALAYIFTNNRKNSDDGLMSTDEFIEKLGPTIDQNQREIVKNIESHPYKKGVYIYKVKGQSFLADEYVLVSGDDRKLNILGNDQFELSDGKSLFFASNKYKNYFKRDINKDLDFQDENKIDYQTYFDYDDSLIDGFDIRKDGENYIIENKKFKDVFDKDYVLIKSRGYSGGEKYVRELVKYDEDFVSYYNEYLDLLKTYEEVKDINLVSPKK